MLELNILYFEVEVLDFALLNDNFLKGKKVVYTKMDLYQKFYNLLINERTNKMLEAVQRKIKKRTHTYS